ncbi:hypothetical protein PQQ96_23180 [Paraburkholderia sediminicola]|uniref:hypothetical protein n=1 Tax=Paraburkholderia sediminicola TaxID=458836 RepID=UPI0038BDE7A3
MSISGITSVGNIYPTVQGNSAQSAASNLPGQTPPTEKRVHGGHHGHHASAASSLSSTASTSSSTDTDSLLSQTDSTTTTTPNGSTPTYTLNGVALGSNINTTA